MQTFEYPRKKVSINKFKGHQNSANADRLKEQEYSRALKHWLGVLESYVIFRGDIDDDYVILERLGNYDDSAPYKMEKVLKLNKIEK